MEVFEMNGKKVFFITALLVIVSTAAFARGPMGGCDGEGPGGGRGQGFFGGMRGFFYPGDRKTETVTGTVLAEKDRIPLLKSGRDEYILVFPWFLMDELNLSSAGQITVTGYAESSPVSGSTQKLLFAKTLKIGDKTYDVESLMKEKGFGPGDCGRQDDEEFAGEGRSGRRGRDR